MLVAKIGIGFLQLMVSSVYTHLFICYVFSVSYLNTPSHSLSSSLIVTQLQPVSEVHVLAMAAKLNSSNWDVAVVEPDRFP